MRRHAGTERARGQSVDWEVDVGSLLRDGISVRLDRQTCGLGALGNISWWVYIIITGNTAYSDLARQ